MPSIDGIPQRIMRNEHFPLRHPVLVIGGAEKDADAEVNVHQIGGNELAIDDNARSDEHRPAPIIHRSIFVIAYLRALEGTPTAKKNAALAHPLVAGQRLVEKVEEI